MNTISHCGIGDLILDSGATLADVRIGYTTYGTLNADRSNVVVVFHALTGDTRAAEWWSGVIGEGKPVDPSHDYVICLNAIGSCYGSTGPQSVDPYTREKYVNTFPKISTHDIALSQLRALRTLGIDHARLGIGGSMGAMILLELALIDPSFFDAIVPIACGASHSAWRIAFSSIICTTIEELAQANGGTDNGYLEGMKLARQIAMTSYRCSDEFESRFARTRRQEKFEVEHYLEHHGQKIARRFDPYSYLRLTQAMESYDVAKQIALLHCPVLFVGIESDILYPESEIRGIADIVAFGEYATLRAGFGHDSFLVAQDELAVLLLPFLRALRPSAIVEEAIS